ncbi:alpha-galactosidase [Microbacterium resistens]|uniref:alpha-galactosidase n=1 Tax=Microbacterium resistens TaxID=156977 RepID=A0ABY3RQL4_9MICO|nr:alpha-galactosidase [Microbacterium resistens]UGS25170.1 alpha-galactosidase [Microbacterium resistens]
MHPPVHLRSRGVSLLLGFESGEAEIIHWGADLGDELPALDALRPPVPGSAQDTPVVVGLIPQASSGWLGRGGLRGSRRGLAFSPALRAQDVTPGADRVRVTQTDPRAGIEVHTDILLDEHGMLRVTHELCNTGTDEYTLDQLGLALPLPPEATEILDLSGRWCRETQPRRHALRDGAWVRSGRHGRTGHDAPLLFAVGTSAFTNRAGRVWAAHLAWSGNREHVVEAVSNTRTIGAAELLGASELVLRPGESYRTPPLYAAFSETGVDGITSVFHRWFRGRPEHPRRIRPVTLNTWEAVYFDHRLGPLRDLARLAADIGVERFVLDDGWFRGRRDDRGGLGDWEVDPDVWPDGLTPLIDAVHQHGMEFGLWVEPEMISLDSDLARAHPEWIARPTPETLGAGGRLPAPWRHQQVLDLVQPAAWQHVFDRLDGLLSQYDIAYLKWDQNRDAGELGSAGRPSSHEQTLAAYRLIDALREAHPGVEIESCSSGGGRIDLGILARTDRVWPSDTNDALERQTIQRWVQSIVPPELVGTHVGPTRSHSTGRHHDITFRAITALFGHFGVEWDLRGATTRDLAVLRRAIALYRQHRDLLHTGQIVNADTHDENLAVHGVVATDGSAALFSAAALGSLVAESPGRIPFPGLDPERRYRVDAVMPSTEDLPEDVDEPFAQAVPPAWWPRTAMTGRFLAEIGLPLPVLRPEQALLLRATAEN